MNSRPFNLFAYLQLFRLPNVFTAAADIMMGFLIAHGRFEPHLSLALLIAASCLMYVAGMVLNDVYDIEQDARERPHRPIPSGRVHPRFALTLGRLLLASGAGCGWIATGLTGDIRSGAIASALAVLVYLYDRILKRTWLGPLGMGGCRFLNVLLGMSTAAVAWQTPHFAAAGGVAIYIVGVTWFARTEAATSGRLQLAAATVLMLAGLIPLYLLPTLETESVVWSFPMIENNWRMIWGLLAVLIGWPCVRAILDPSPGVVQRAVGNAIVTLILLDAAAAHPAAGVLVVYIAVMMFPMMLLRQYVYST